MEINFSTLLAGFIFGTFGIYLIKEGRRVENPRKLVIGIVMLVFPYFIDSAIISWVLGTALFVASFKV